VARSLTAVAWIGRLLGSPRAVDILLWAAITSPVLLTDEALPQGSLLSLAAFRLVVAVLLGLAVVVSRMHPVIAAALPAVLALAVTGEFYSEPLVLAQLALAFLLGRRTGGARAALQLVAVLGTSCVVSAVVNRGGSAEDWFTLASGMLLQIALPWTAGQYARQHAELLRAGWELAERLEREQDLVANQVRLRERARIARDMHDSLGHELSLIAVRAAALQVTPGIDEQGQRSAAQLRKAAASSTERLRDIIGMLRDDDDRPPVTPPADTVQSLVQQASASGVNVTLEDRTREPDASVPEATARAAYRVVQEALTNATKHAPGALVTVTLRLVERAGSQEMAVDVVNGASPTAPPRGDDAQGYGLIGLDERIRLVGGTLDAHSTAGGFTVSARLPLTTVATVASPAATAPTSSHALAAARARLRRSLIGTFWIPAAMAAVLVLVYFLNSGRL
jgi:signal transduction histidine kinase